MAVSLRPIGLHPLVYKQKFKFEVSASDWDKEDDICMHLPPVPGIESGHDLEAWLERRGSTRSLYLSGCFNYYADYEENEGSVDYVIVEVVLLKKKEIKFQGRGHPDNEDRIEFLLPEPRQIELFNEEDKFTLEVIMEIASRKRFIGMRAGENHGLHMKCAIYHHESSDVKIVSKGREFKCHRNILCSVVPAFEMMLKGETAENRTSIINIGDWDQESVELMIEFLYTGVIPEIPARIEMDLFKLAVKYNLRPLVESCGDEIIKNLTVDNFLPTYAEFDIHGQIVPDFKDQAMEFFKKNDEQIVRREDYLEFCRDFPLLNQELIVATVEAYKQAAMEMD